jgi:hypothetical protein
MLVLLVIVAVTRYFDRDKLVYMTNSHPLETSQHSLSVRFLAAGQQKCVRSPDDCHPDTGPHPQKFARSSG